MLGLYGKASLFICWLLLFITPLSNAAQNKILYVDSYHESYPWSAGITEGIQSVLNNRDDIELRIIRMDTKRNKSEAHGKSVALDIKKFIQTWRPNVVITSDDNAAKYLVAPYFKESDLPFVFCGINRDADGYGFPTENITGMVEVQLIDQILGTLQEHARGPRVAFLKGDELTARKEADFFEKRTNLQFDKRFVTDFTTWKNQYLALQNEADMILLGNRASITGWDDDEALAFIRANARVPSGGWATWMAPYNLVTFASKPEEQGEWAATTALRILGGTDPAEIPITTNVKAEIYLNMVLAKKLGIKFHIDLIQRATFVSEMSAP